MVKKAEEAPLRAGSRQVTGGGKETEAGKVTVQRFEAKEAKKGCVLCSGKASVACDFGFLMLAALQKRYSQLLRVCVCVGGVGWGDMEWKVVELLQEIRNWLCKMKRKLLSDLICD